jgi:disulfide bond formation protein DsbB
MQRATYLIGGGAGAALIGLVNPQAAAILVFVVGLAAFGLGVLLAIGAVVDTRYARPQAQRKRY